MEIRRGNAQIKKAGGNASKSALSYRIGIPTSWAVALGITADSREMELSFDGLQITIKKAEDEK